MTINIIHQIWWQGEKNIPLSYPNFGKKCIEKNKNFIYMFWDEKKINNLIKYYPKYKKTFENLPFMIQKIDMAKYLILHRYGGIYIDMDCECLKSFSDLLKDKDIMLVQMNVNPFEKLLSYNRVFEQVLQNGVMGGKKRHPFWLHCLDLLKNQDIDKKFYDSHFRYIFRTTGPGLLTEAYLSYPNK